MNGIIISNNSQTPIYRQIYEQLSSGIIRGNLPSEFPLPPIRTAARELKVSIITVKKAWEELEREGFIYTNVGKGCFVASLSNEELSEKKNRIIVENFLKDKEFYKNYGLTKEDMIKLVENHF